MESLIPTAAMFAIAVVAGMAGLSVFSDLFFKDRSRINRRIDERFRGDLRKKVERSSAFQNLNQPENASNKKTGAFARVRENMLVTIEQSGVSLTFEKLMLLCACAAGGVFIVATILAGHPVIGVIFAPVGFAIPVFVVRRKRTSRLDKMRAQLPDAFDLIARSVRAGNTFWQGMLSVAQEFEQPIAAEMAYCHELQNFGVPSDVALQELSRRCGLVEMRILVEALTVQQQTGGSLGEILDKLAHTVRERFRIWGKIKTLTAEGRIQAVFLVAMAPIMLAGMLFLNYDFFRVLVDIEWHGIPSIWLVVMAFGELLGWMWIRKIVNFDF